MTPIRITSFAFRDGGRPPAGVDHVFDARWLPNPHDVPELRPLDGRNPAVRDWLVHSTAMTAVFLANAMAGVTRHPGNVAVGCFGGRHRSVAVAEMLAILLRLVDYEVEVVHSALEGAK